MRDPAQPRLLAELVGDPGRRERRRLARVGELALGPLASPADAALGRTAGRAGGVSGGAGGVAGAARSVAGGVLRRPDRIGARLRRLIPCASHDRKDSRGPVHMGGVVYRHDVILLGWYIRFF